MFAICPGFTRTDMTLSQQMTMDEQVELFDRYKEYAPWQSAHDVGKAVVLLFSTGTTGTSYTVDGGKPPIVSPDRVNISIAFLDSL
ncbi:hypothetical protein O3G_MSEX012877 [Manduca sexta]|uniref:Uncharacterized protein n=2 Tax=Manduca sexta TaxID=7130 RepID=A0A922CYF5_MANSE|nr:hypothetical protein O3G_MSEX012877 [Manduca sexta]